MHEVQRDESVVWACDAFPLLVIITKVKRTVWVRVMRGKKSASEWKWRRVKLPLRSVRVEWRKEKERREERRGERRVGVAVESGGEESEMVEKNESENWEAPRRESEQKKKWTNATIQMQLCVFTRSSKYTKAEERRVERRRESIGDFCPQFASQANPLIFTCVCALTHARPSPDKILSVHHCSTATTCTT